MPKGDQLLCEWCDRFDQPMVGIKLALRHFGRNPRTIPKQCRTVMVTRAADSIIVPWPQPPTRRPDPGRTLLSRRRRRQGLDNEVPIREHHSQLQLASESADVFPQRAQEEIGLLLHTGDGSLGNIESLGDRNLCLLARLAQLVNADALEFGVRFPLQIRANLGRGLVL